MDNLRSMDFFMGAELESQIEIEVPGISKFKYPIGHEKEGQVIPWILKAITTDRLSQLTQDNTRITRQGGRVIKNIDETRLTNDLMVETIVYPNFKDKSWLESTKCLDPVDLLLKVLSLPGDYSRISKEITDVNGMLDNQEELIKEVKN